MCVEKEITRRSQVAKVVPDLPGRMPDAAGDYTNKLTFGTLPRTERGKPLVLSADPKGKTFLYTNNNSVIIRDLERPELERRIAL